MTRSTLPIEIRQPSDAAPAATLDFISSDASLDRYAEVISPSGWKVETYLRNPVFQNSHQYGDILFTLGKALITEVRSGDSSSPHSALRTPHLFQRIQFATEVNPVARIAHGLYAGQFLRGVSVGFIPIRWEDSDGTEQQVGRAVAAAPLENQKSKFKNSPPCRRKYLEQELLEVSAVAIPANPNALALAYKSGAVEKSDLQETIDLLSCLKATIETKSNTSTNPTYSEVLSLVRQFRDLLRS